jgi:hypothetical protein
MQNGYPNTQIQNHSIYMAWYRRFNTKNDEGGG